MVIMIIIYDLSRLVIMVIIYGTTRFGWVRSTLKTLRLGVVKVRTWFRIRIRFGIKI